ncbi:hypothetical protein QYG89_05320 [Bacillus sp. B190/17]|uniref:Uncharacterized protein n=1 Tax=Bacillus lumedeiriae TaxID=3058829 RepID=A0ABW8I6I6_9BACI
MENALLPFPIGKIILMTSVSFAALLIRAEGERLQRKSTGGEQSQWK